MAFLHTPQIRKEFSVLAKLLPNSCVIDGGKIQAVCRRTLCFVCCREMVSFHHHSTRRRSNSESCSSYTFCPSESHKPNFSIQGYKMNSLISGLYSGGLHQRQHHQGTKNIKKFIIVRNRAQRPWLVGWEYKSSMTNIAYLQQNIVFCCIWRPEVELCLYFIPKYYHKWVFVYVIYIYACVYFFLFT